jgi:sodium transport system permease protein
MPASVSAILSQQPGLSINNIPESDIDTTKQRISNRETDLLINFPSNFDESVAAHDPAASAEPPPNIQIWANSARTESMQAQNIVTGILNYYHDTLSHKIFTINAPVNYDPQGEAEVYELASDSDIAAMVMGMIIPMMFILFIYQGCMALAPESISGEKERGTLGALLVTPANRSDMALAKILSISIFGLLGAIGSIVAMVLSLPKMMQIDAGAMDIFSAKEYALLLVVAVSTTLVFVSLLSLMSAYAKTIKEANAYAVPLMLVCLVIGMSSMITGGGAASEIYYYLIPVFNSSQCVTAIINFDASIANTITTVSVNVVFTLICTALLAKMFSSERIVFDK